MTKLRSFSWFIFLLIFPVFIIMQVSDGKELLPDVPPTTTIVKKQCHSSLSSLTTPLPSRALMYNDDILISQYEYNMQCELDAAYRMWWAQDHKISKGYYFDFVKKNQQRENLRQDFNVKQTKIKEKYRNLINKAVQQNILNRQKQKEIDQHNKEVKMNHNEMIVAGWTTFGLIIVLCVYAYFRRRHLDDHKFAQDKEERQYNLQVKQLELNQTLQLQQAELERYKTLELSKTQMDNEHEVALKKIEFDKSIDARDFMFTVTKEEREYLLKQRELDIKEGKSSPSFMDIVDSNKDVQIRLKK